MKARLRTGIFEPRGRLMKSSIRLSRSRLRSTMTFLMRLIAGLMAVRPIRSPGMVFSVWPRIFIFWSVDGSSFFGTLKA